MVRLIHNFCSENLFFRNFHPNEADKRSLLFSLPFSKVLEWYFHYKKSYIGKKENIDYLVTWPT